MSAIGQNQLVSSIRKPDVVDTNALTQIKRVSDLEAPIMLLEGHKREVYSCRFSNDGRLLASGSFDKNICSCIV
jgi:WD40 repeat protein